MKTQYIAYLMLFVAGVWGGNELVKLFSNNEEITLAASQQLNQQAHDFSLQDVEGKVHQFSEWGNKVRVLNFWATWCPPCRKSFPWMEEMHQKYSDLGFKVIAISTDVKRSVIDQFLKDLTTNFIIAHEPTGEAASKFKVTGMPNSYLIDRKGNIRLKHAGFNSKDKSKLEAEIKKLIATD